MPKAPYAFNDKESRYYTKFMESTTETALQIYYVAKAAASAYRGAANWFKGLRSVDDVGLSTRGFRPKSGTRVQPEGIPDNWRITNTKQAGGTLYKDPTNAGNSVRVMQGSPNSPYVNSRNPYVRWQKNGQPLDVNGNQLPTAHMEEAHIPLDQFKFLPEVFQ